MWKKCLISFDSPFYKVYSQVIKKVSFGQKEIVIAVINKERSQNLKIEVKENFKFVFDWQDEVGDIVGVELYQLIGENNNVQST
jgi:hypothetical protein